MSRCSCLVVAVVCSLVWPAAECGAAAKKRPPNIVLFLVDDMGWNDVGCYGNTFHETPNIDAFAKQGMRFTNAYAACPVCSPTRASIMSGKYPATLNLTDFIPGHWRPYEKLVVPKMNLQLPLKEVTLAEMVKPAGYVSASFGKWHLGGRTHYPDKQGFDDWVVTGGRHFAPKFRTTPKTPVKKGEYLGDFLTRQAERFMEQNRDKPFLLYLPHYAVHIPLEAKQGLVEKYRKKAGSPALSVRISAPKAELDKALRRVQIVLSLKGKPSSITIAKSSENSGETVARATVTATYPAGTDIDQPFSTVKKVAPSSYGQGVTVDDLRVVAVQNPTYAAMVEHIDQSLGRVLKKLDELKIAENTVVVFFSDNGGLYRRFDERGPAVMSNHPLRGEKGGMYEGGIREPCIVRWPGVVKPGSECETPISSVDFWPTIAEIAGTRSKFQHAVDGVSLLPLLKQSGNLKDRALYWHYPHYHHTAPAGAIRHGDFKLIEYFEDGKLELYNLAKDLSELQDLAQTHPAKTRELHAMLKAWRKRVGAKMPTQNPNFDPERRHEWKRRPRPGRKKAQQPQ